MTEDRIPMISVITVVRNAAEVIEACIQSVLSQSGVDLEYLVIDGASTDGTLEIIQRYSGSIDRLVSEPDTGLYDAMNKGLRLARGRHVHFLNADDRYASATALRDIWPMLNDSSICYGQMLYVERSGRKRWMGTPFNHRAELRESRIPQPALLVPRVQYEQVGEFRSDLLIAADYDMVLRLIARVPARYIAKPLTIMHDGGISYRRMTIAFKESREVSILHGCPASTAWMIYLRRLVKWRVKQLLPAWLTRILTTARES